MVKRITILFVYLFVYAQCEPYTFSNDYTQVTFDTTKPSITSLRGDFNGNGNYGINVVSKGIVLERVDAGPSYARHSSNDFPLAQPLIPQVIKNNEGIVVIFEGVLDSNQNPKFNSTWALTLSNNNRSLGVEISCVAITDVDISTVNIGAYFATQGIYALYKKGIVQTMDSSYPFFASNNPLKRLYSLHEGSIDASFPNEPSNIILVNAWETPGSGFQILGAGTYPTLNTWTNNGWNGASSVHINSGQLFTFSFSLTPNGQDFPIGTIPIGPNLPFEDLQAIYTGIYASPVGAIISYQSAPEGKIAPCIAHPIRCYSGLYNFYDPDTFISISSMLYAADDYLFNECSKLLDTSLSRICRETTPNSNCTAGQIPHHFIEQFQCNCKGCPKCNCIGSECVTYNAISGAVQTGPNVFWILAALKYVKESGDYDWLRTRIDDIRFAMSFLLTFYNPNYGLISAPGPLWIDTFIRDNFTSDTNAMAVHLFRVFALAESFLGNNTGFNYYLGIAGNIAVALNKYVWNETANDHYLTQRNLDGSTRDFVDYDSNLLAVAFGACPDSRVPAVLKRVDSGKCTHARATYVSEVYYDAQNCNGGNTGDSAVTMGRIGWADALARKRTKDVDTFNNLLLKPLQDNLIANTWMYERFQCDTQPTHNPFYIEYPEVVVMMLREVRYGIDIGFNTLTIEPLGFSNFTYNIGGLSVNYNPNLVNINIIPEGDKSVLISGLVPNSNYQIVSVNTQTGQKSYSNAKSDNDGNLSFIATFGRYWNVNAQRQ